MFLTYNMLQKYKLILFEKNNIKRCYSVQYNAFSTKSNTVKRWSFFIKKYSKWDFFSALIGCSVYKEVQYFILSAIHGGSNIIEPKSVIRKTATTSAGWRSKRIDNKILG